MSQRTAQFGNARYGETRYNYERVIHRIHIPALYDLNQPTADAEYDMGKMTANAVYEAEKDTAKVEYEVAWEPADALVQDTEASSNE